MGVPPDRPLRRVAVIGFGYVGSCLAAQLADRGLDVLGVDADAELVAGLNDGHCPISEPGLPELIQRGMASGRLRVTGDYAGTAEADVVVISVGTPVRDDGSLADDQLRDVCAELSRYLRRGQLVVLKSTVGPGTTRNTVLPLLEKSGLTGGEDFTLAFTPERLAEGTALRELRSLPIVVGGLDEKSTREAADFWRGALGVDTIPQPSMESAEIVKLADNWWIDHNIALAGELALFCDLYDVDVLDVIKAANTIPKGDGRVNILQPGVGVGGSCLTKDPWMVWHAARQRGVDLLTAPTARRVNDAMPVHTAQLILAELRNLGRDPDTATVAVLGLAFKNNSGDLRATPVLPVVRALRGAGVTVRTYDPLVDADAAARLFGARPERTVQDAVRDADCIAVLALHRELEDLDYAALPVRRTCLIVDGRAHYSKDQIAGLRALGHVYRGLGRS
ncbi:GDP-mannose 6-dehydrogenase [Streptomyces sp. YIM 130001]|uniref:nucleotide sugar dehydrogenase n=1 Tax=Streptomyces sp. YIM 130001 TaxID=2259644 RepID=UPI000E652077|nr:nucleotide sugar dehydrogenase [Streptomyces sp. YIM 130001]RII07932.1 GDP-mannose 6-dehydrogenase [Streptomyces sp. YIM 130001]